MQQKRHRNIFFSLKKFYENKLYNVPLRRKERCQKNGTKEFNDGHEPNGYAMICNFDGERALSSSFCLFAGVPIDGRTTSG